MYDQLDIVINEIKDTSLMIIAGDMNSKIGKAKKDEECCGNYSRGERNRSGSQLIDFCNIQDLFITNSAFPHPARHITTWENQRIIKKNGHQKVITTYNQIDYIIIPKNRKHILKDARSYKGTLVTSDHRLVVSRMRIELYRSGILVPLQKPNKEKGPPINLRPVILLPILRKILSNILLSRANEKIDDFLSHSQSAYRSSRRTSDIVWSHRWMAAKIQINKESYYKIGIDMSSAFDTIRRHKLI